MHPNCLSRQYLLKKNPLMTLKPVKMLSNFPTLKIHNSYLALMSLQNNL